MLRLYVLKRALFGRHSSMSRKRMIYQRALRMHKQHMNADYPAAALPSHLAERDRMQGRDEQAQPLYQDALSLCQQEAGPAHLPVDWRCSPMHRVSRSRPGYALVAVSQERCTHIGDETSPGCDHSRGLYTSMQGGRKADDRLS
jgi:hypothetical protein